LDDLSRSAAGPVRRDKQERPARPEPPRWGRRRTAAHRLVSAG